MTSRPLAATALALSAALVLAAGAVQAQPAPADAKPADAKPADAKAATAAPSADGPVAAPPAGKGQVVFFRRSRLGGMAVSFTVHEGDTGVGKLGNGSYFVLVADPGPHTYTIQSEATDKLNVEVDAGETQYVEETIGMGLVMARPHLTPSDKATFDGLAAKLKMSEKKPTDLKAATPAK